MIKNVKIWSINGRIGESESCFNIKRTLNSVILTRKVKSESYDFRNFENFSKKERARGIKTIEFNKSEN